MKWNSKLTVPSIVSVFILSGLLAYTNCGSKSGSSGSSFTQKNPFISVWETTTANETIMLPLREGFKYNMTVDWGDGTELQKITSWNDNHKAHEYVEAGTHTITLKGLAEAWYFNACGTTPDTGSEANIISITDLGGMGWKSFENAFCGCENLTTIKGGDTSNVTNMKQMFWGSYNAEPNVKDWDTSKVTNMSHIFDGVMFVNLDVSDWDTSSVTDMSGMFSNTSASVDLRNWDTSKVTTMEDMFIAANANSNVSGLDTDKVINMRQMFYLSAVNPVMKDWNFAKVENMSQMLIGSQISTLHYTELLKRVHETRTMDGVELDATAQYYDSADAARTDLIDTNGWAISDNGSAGADPG